MFRIRHEINGLHMFNPRSGDHVLFDEIPNKENPIAPQQMSIALTNHCTLNCPYCYVNKGHAFQNTATIIDWCIELDKMECLGIGLGGGEPTEHPDIAVICKNIKENTSLAISITTNGLLFDKMLSSKLKNNVDFIRLSLKIFDNSPLPLSDRIFSRQLDCLTYIKDICKFGVNIVVDNNTINELTKIANFLITNGAKQILLLPICDKSGKIHLSENNLDKLNQWIIENSHNYPLATSGYAIHSLDVPYLFQEKVSGTNEFMHIDALGNLKRTVFSQDFIPLQSSKSLRDGLAKIHQIEQQEKQDENLEQLW